ncbi:hypothetical protein, partial [uncultured Flavobacterium sp.]|uniref:hypothetical protein n=1 Tax=uncultured Flavobacterium sp. TaxID=165435 RepID=UPI0027E0A71A
VFFRKKKKKSQNTSPIEPSNDSKKIISFTGCLTEFVFISKNIMKKRKKHINTIAFLFLLILKKTGNDRINGM